MKNIFKYIAGVLVAGFAMTSCSPEDFTGANGNIPQASDYTDNFKVTVDQTTNYANFEFTSAPGVDRKSTRLNSSHWNKSRMPSSA